MWFTLDTDAQSTHRAFGAPLFTAILRATPDDFVVHEQMTHEPAGEGEHLWLHIEKRGLDTQEVRQALACAAAVQERDVGHAGLKDRHARTRQWFSVRVPTGTADADVTGRLTGQLGDERLRVLESVRHTRKLRVGAHRGNAFEIVLRDVRAGEDVVDRDAVRSRLERVRAVGFPNAFGAQRFGQGGTNVAQARAMLDRSGRRLTRHKRGLLLSAARAHLFNRVLGARVARGDWTAALPGEPLMLAGSRSVFVPSVDEFPDAREMIVPNGSPGSGRVSGSDDAPGSSGPCAIGARLAMHDLSPTGPLPGKGERLVQRDCAAFEEQVLSDESALIDALCRAGVDSARRALCVYVPDLALDMPPDGTLRFRFTLPPGSFATTLLDQFGHCRQERSS